MRTFHLFIHLFSMHAAARSLFEPTTSWSQFRHLTLTPPSHNLVNASDRLYKD